MATTDPAKTQSVLDTMTAAFGAVKAGTAAKAGLTPVGVEKGGPMAPILPNDLPGRFLSNEALRDAATSLREQAEVLIATAESIDTLTGMSSIREPHKALVSTQEAQVKAAEKAADERAAEPTPFDAEFAAKAAAAQAATFGDAPASTSDWKCPDHPRAKVQFLKSRKGRTYAACTTTDCQQTERLGAS